jgi:hypothetical protein
MLVAAVTVIMVGLIAASYRPVGWLVLTTGFVALALADDLGPYLPLAWSCASIGGFLNALSRAMAGPVVTYIEVPDPFAEDLPVIEVDEHSSLAKPWWASRHSTPGD